MQVDLLVIGLGYVGLPLVREATSAGLSVVGYDVGQGVVNGLNGGHSHVDGISDDDVARMLAAGFRATTSEPGPASRTPSSSACPPRCRRRTAPT